MGALERYFELTQANAQQQKPGHILGYNVPASTVRMNPFMDNGSSQPQQQPQVDTADPINSLAGMLVTPAEREAQEQKLLKNKRRMIAWTGLFDGLRNLANLYAVTKGAAPMKFTDNPYQAIEQGFKEEQQRQDNLNNYQDRYAKQLYDLQRQGEQDQMRREAQQAQMRWYDTRDEIARLKEERDRIKNEKYIELQDGRIAKINAETGQIEALTPYKVDTEKSKAQKNRQQGQAAVTRAINSGKNGGKPKNSKKTTTRRRSATQL